MLYSAGLRVSECAGLDLSPGLDNINSGWVHVLGKGAKERLAPIGSKSLQALNTWLKIRSEHALQGEQAVFVNRFGKRLSVRSIQNRLDKRANEAGLPTKMSPHRLRHACATHVLESSGDLRAVQEMLGHENLSTTQIYTKLDMQHLAKVYDSAHPRAKKRRS
ncbi:site-specific tyrosine recombinase (fragment) [uncultured Thiomicrorhabdus sp.]